MRIMGVDITETPRPAARPALGRANAWAHQGISDNHDLLNPAWFVRLIFTNEHHQLETTDVPMLGRGNDPTPLLAENIVVALLASHPADIAAAIASGRVLGWTPIASSTSIEDARLGYAITLATTTT
ncbi:hypothetical protein [Glaciihabitans sp. dw_435]|uniref:hypothetical protein n=1 Tax=Glaciihabitans sp. dw_435 TaxID=2720081 RepID=UPI001BD3B624|nr:hypothetical protein [Glaciihabitans sp. dw_435]